MTHQRHSSKHRRLLVIMVAMLALLPILAACGGGNSASTSTTTASPTQSVNPNNTPTATQGASIAPSTAPTNTNTAIPSPLPATPTPAPATVTANSSPQVSMLKLAVYFLRDGTVTASHRTIEKTLQVAEASVKNLIAGPDAAESAAGLTSALPTGITYDSTTIDDAVATLNLSGPILDSDPVVTRQWMAQMVYTLTQFPTVTGVIINLNGQSMVNDPALKLDSMKPLTRASFEQETPTIFVETPSFADAISSPVRLTGTANTFEATFIARVLDAGGNIVAEEVVTATSGSGTRGMFDVTIPFSAPAGDGTIMVFEESAKDGSPVHVVQIPVVFR